MKKVPELIKKEDEFCESIECIKNQYDQYIYCSDEKGHGINLPYILLEYKQWMIEQGYIKQIK